MEVLILTMFASLTLVALGLLLLVYLVRASTFEHSDRMALAPLREDLTPAEDDPSSPPEKPADTEGTPKDR